MSRRQPIRDFHGGPEIRTPKSKHSKHLRGLKGWTEGGSSGRVRVIVRDGRVMDDSRYREIQPQIEAALKRKARRRKRILNPARIAESHVTAKTLAGRGGVPAQYPTSPAGSLVNDRTRRGQGQSDTNQSTRLK